MQKVRVGVIGCGAIAEYLHIPDYQVCPEAELTAFCDANEDRAREMARRFAPDAEVFTDYREMLAKGPVDAVSVCLPNILHGPVTIAAAEAGKHIMVEKPMAVSVEEGEAMIAAAKKTGVLLLVNQTQRRFAPHLKAKEVLDSGILGKVLHVSAMFGHAGPEHWSPEGTWFFDAPQARFGAMADLGVHKADLIRYLTGKEVAEISAFSERIEKEDASVEDNFVSCLRFSDGTVGTLSASWTVKGESANYTYIHCANGTLALLTNPDKPVVAYLEDPKCEINFEVPPPLNHYEDSWGVDVGGAFVRAILGKEAPFCTGEEGLKSLQIIFAAEEAAKTRKTVSIAH